MKDTVLGIIRHVLTAVGGALVAKGTIDEATLTAAVGAIVTLIGVAWSIIEKRRRATE